ncbi:nucleoside/nucleotide kinase family protein [Nocardioides gansuensis]|uniref:Nucleoside/nucleotide kinase family protein n=1 Tax=Nocardioides gansuensis TaxID=2138300 RepID=A0A2T8FDA5_9ACTN|nr:nucleoside/nucleotide kinase family protein [Nocardioides gansuensis]PVG83683.1 nucleoside/nucleotide kinase family protein [Nocardioides gansuensis]
MSRTDPTAVQPGVRPASSGSLGGPPCLEPAALPERLVRMSMSGRVVVGITGAPGSGKSTLAASLASRMGERCVVVPMDGFHLTDAELGRLGLADRKGAPETFDVRGFVHAVGRIRREVDATVYLPEFDRSAEQSVAGAIAVRPTHCVVLVEGNYLLLDAPGWQEVRSLLDEVWFVEGDEDVRVRRLVERHVRHGRSPDAAEEWVMRSDQANAALVAATRTEADAVVRID